MIKFIFFTIVIGFLGLVAFFAFNEVPAPEQKITKVINNDDFYRKSE